MIQITAQMRVLVAIDAVDGRKGIDSLVRLCQEKLAEDPFSGCVFVFRSRGGTAIRLLSYDDQWYWLAQKRLSKGRFVWRAESPRPAKPLEAYEAQLLKPPQVIGRALRVLAVAPEQWSIARHGVPRTPADAGARRPNPVADGELRAA